MSSFSVTGRFIDLRERRIFPAEVVIDHGKISAIHPLSSLPEDAGFILPGFIDAHVHIESSMLIPSSFARLAVAHGTVGTVSDPHEIANVCGVEGVRFMIANGKTVPFKFHFGAPSCVPATSFETAGDALDAEAVHALLKDPDIFYLSEMMNFPGVLNGDAEVLKKIRYARECSKPVDGHAPGLRGAAARKYISAGISTDHECFTKDEALDKLGAGMKIIIREGSAAKNFEALADLIDEFPDRVMLCSDDKHPDSLVDGHINRICARAVRKGLDIFNILRAACLNPVEHYGMKTGQLRTGDPADFIIVDDLAEFNVRQTYVDGRLVAEKGKSFITSHTVPPINRFHCNPKTPADLRMAYDDQSSIAVIEALDGQLITNKRVISPSVVNGEIVPDPSRDLLKIVVVNRYREAPVAKALIRNFGLRSGAIASSVAHDSHNIVAVGTDDAHLADAINLVIDTRGGISFVNDEHHEVLPLPVAGLMSDLDGYEVAKKYSALDQLAKAAGSPLSAPFMTLSFMALLVIPYLKLSDLGLFDGERFRLM